MSKFRALHKKNNTERSFRMEYGFCAILLASDQTFEIIVFYVASC